MGNKVPTLSTTGWEEEPHGKADRILTYFFISDSNQSNLYAIQTLQQLVKEYGRDSVDLERAVGDALSRLFLQYFDSAEIKVSIVANDPTNDTALDIRVEAIVVDGNTRLSVGRLVNVIDSTINTVIKLNN